MPSQIYHIKNCITTAASPAIPCYDIIYYLPSPPLYKYINSMKIIFLFLISAVVGILLSAQSSSAASIRLRRTNSVGVESSDHDDKAPSYAAMNRNSIRSLQGLDKSMSMSMMTAGIESATESGSDDWVAEVINKLESETGVAIIQSVAMNIIKSNELPAHHHHSGQMKCRWFLTLLFKYKHYYFLGFSDDYLNHILDYVCSEDETTSTSTVAASGSECPNNPTKIAPDICGCDTVFADNAALKDAVNGQCRQCCIKGCGK